jgi:hypothetical protein
MSAEIIQFIPRSNPKADRAFWIGPQPDPLEVLAFDIMNQVMPDTSPSEYCAPEKDPA